MHYEHKPLKSSWVDIIPPKPMHDIPPSAIEIWHEKHNQIDVENVTIVVTFQQGLTLQKYYNNILHIINYI